MVRESDPPETDLGSELYRKPKVRKPSVAESSRGYDEVEQGYLHENDPALLSVRGQPALAPSYVKKNLPDLMEAEKAGTLWTPLYPPQGGPAQGFRCNQLTTTTISKIFGYCNRVTRTERGMKSHLWSVHQIKQQQELLAMSKKEWEKG